jgi:membrane protease YdiL (CAAX protease family)
LVILFILEEPTPALEATPVLTLLVGALGLLFALASAPRVFRLQARLAGPNPLPGGAASPWTLRHLVPVVGLLVVTALLVAGTLALALTSDGGGEEAGGASSLLLSLLGTALILGVPCAALVIFARNSGPEGGRGIGLLGLGADGRGRAALAGAFAWLLLLPGIFGLGILWPALLSAAGQTPQPQPFIGDFLEGSGASLAFAVFLAAIVLPFLEELLFRGFLQPLLASRFGTAAAILVTSLLFAALHGLSAFGPIFGLSLVMGTTMARTGRLTSSWAIHALHNGSMLLLLLSVPEIADLLPEGGLFSLVL